MTSEPLRMSINWDAKPLKPGETLEAYYPMSLDTSKNAEDLVQAALEAHRLARATLEKITEGELEASESLTALLLGTFRAAQEACVEARNSRRA